MIAPADFTLLLPAHLTLAQRETVKNRLRMEYADYAGFQEGYRELPGFDLWHLRVDIAGHPRHSTVSEATLDAGIGL